MAEDWKEQLNSDDPKIRAQAVKKLAVSGDESNLLVLKSIVETDPDPNVREYAKKAARHLFRSLQTQQQEEETPADVAPEPIPQEVDRTDPEESHRLAEELNIPRSDIQEADQKVQRAYSLHLSGRTPKAIPVYAQALELNPTLKKDSYARSIASELTGKIPDEALRILMDPSEREDLIADIKGKPGKSDQETDLPSSKLQQDQEPIDRSSSNIFQTWMSFFQMDEMFLKGEVRKANNEDTLLSVFVFTIAAVIIFLINGSLQLQQINAILNEELPQLGVNLGMIFFIILIGTVVMTPVGFYINTGMQYLGVRLFGGSSDFKTHAYLMALIQVPTTILGGLLGLLAQVPVVNIITGLAGFALSIYVLILTIRAIKVAHHVSTGRALGGIIIPPILISVVVGCIMMIFGSALIGLLGQAQ
jgi:hypothetical protein